MSVKRSGESGRREGKDRAARLDEIWAKYQKRKSEHVRNQLIEAYLSTVGSIAERLKLKLPESVDIDDLFWAVTICATVARWRTVTICATVARWRTITICATVARWRTVTICAWLRIGSL